MSSDKTKRLRLNKWVGSDQVLRSEFNENFDKIDAYVDDSLAVKTTSVQLKQGLQVIDVNQSSPLNNVTIQGRTLVNLLGRDGNCEDLTKWGTFQVSQALDSNNKSIGNNAIKLTLSTGFTSGSISTITTRTFSFKAGKYYVAIADIKNGTATNGNFYINGTTAAKGQHIITATDKFYPAWRAYNPDADVSGLSMVLCINGAAGQYAYFDGVRIYEITQAEYNALDSMTPEQIAAKWPYVDDMKSVYSPYIIKYGENLLPPFMEWNYVSPTGVFKEPYTLSIIGGTNPISYNAWVIVPVLRNTSYTLSAQHNGRIAVYTQTVQPIAEYTTSGSLTFNSGDNNVVHVYFSANGSNGVFSFTNPMLNLGPDALQFKPRNDDHLFFPNLQLASNVDRTVYDTLFQLDGKYWKQVRFKTMDLTGDLEWEPLGKGPGWKSVTTNANTVADALLNSNFGLSTFKKFDGKILSPYSTTSGLDTGWIPTDYSVRIGIPNSDSGWDDAYPPSPGDIKAYFNGWRMFQEGQDPNTSTYKSGTKWWLNRGNDTTTTTPNIVQSAWKVSQSPYKLQYQLVTPTVEEVRSEGGITLHEGPNHFEVGAGMIIHERVTPHTDFVSVGINNYSPGWERSRTKYRVGKFFGVYRNGLRDGWRYDDVTTSGGYGGVIAVRSPQGFNAGDPYTVTYLALDQHALSCNVQSIQFDRAANMKTVVDTLAAGQSDMVARVGALEITRAQRAQPQWINATPLSGWVNYGGFNYNLSYMKDELGFVHVRGTIKGGATYAGAVLFILPRGYRPTGLTRTVTTNGLVGGGTAPTYLAAEPSYGNVFIDISPISNEWLEVNLIPFLAEAR
ncbi:hypothetical protein [Paenibacillus oleatilyticus]|uniref:hypothetical protein n=1 Tax=Paenibacillus oleatilyticus TaxID=2594886 RepID=UPI001C1F530D|nr:hypothetical protein [Paenibacillus oleatilyticus]MBU7316233.1 hypothetical protein [Paenibacillus oleatilyticus]